MSRRPCHRRVAAGFTMVELTVALVAGLIVALGIVGLSREATRTFHEEVRTSAAEAALRTAVDRLRSDLQRAAYMSTPDIRTDTMIAHAPGAANVSTSLKGILRLAGVRLIDGGSLANTPISGWQQPALVPDAIEIGGNMTCAEQFEVESVQPAGSCTRLTLSATSPSMYRITAVGAAAAAAELNNVFQPAPGYQFMVRLLDDTGRSQYLATCPGATTAGFATATQPYVDVSTATTPVLTANATKTLGGVSSTPGGRAFVNPVQLVKWEITSTANEPAQYRNALGNQGLSGAVDATKYDLVRSFMDAGDNVVPETTEVIAEYAVDLDFAFSVESGTGPANPAMTTLAFDNAANQTWADDVSTGNPAINRPERVRLVRARVATRAAIAERTTTVPVTQYGAAQGFLYRYCVIQPCTVPPPSDGVLRWARVRTLTTEVSLPNQATAY